MGRRKLQLNYISNMRRRAATFRKRKEGLKKKAAELAALCDIDVAVVCFGPDGDAGADVWPKDDDVRRIATRYYRSLDEMSASGSRRRRVLDRRGYLVAEKEKEKARLERAQAMAAKEVVQSSDGWLESATSAEAVSEIVRAVDAKIEAVRQRIKTLNENRSCEDAAGGLSADVPPSTSDLPPQCSTEDLFLIPQHSSTPVTVTPMGFDCTQVADDHHGIGWYYEPNIMWVGDELPYGPLSECSLGTGAEVGAEELYPYIEIPW